MKNKSKDLHEYQVKIYYFKNTNSFPSKKKNTIIKNMDINIFHQFLDINKEIPPIPKEYNKYKNYKELYQNLHPDQRNRPHIHKHKIIIFIDMIFIYSNIFKENMKYYLSKYIERLYYIFFHNSL